MGSKNSKKQSKYHNDSQPTLSNKDLEKPSLVETTLVLLTVNHAQMALAPFTTDESNN